MTKPEPKMKNEVSGRAERLRNHQLQRATALAEAKTIQHTKKIMMCLQPQRFPPRASTLEKLL